MTPTRLAPVLLALALWSCSGPALDTRTFELRYLDGAEAAQILEPYVYRDRPDGAGSMTHSGHLLTVRETSDNLEKIARVLAEFDMPKPRVRIRFQLIEANGAGRTDSAIAEIEQELRKLFRFGGYRLVAEAYIGGTEASSIEQVVGREGDPAGNSWVISARIHSIRATGDSGTVHLSVGVRNPMRGGLETTLNARAGQTVVVGNAQLARGGGTLILAVRPELVTN